MQILKDEIRNKILEEAEGLFYKNGYSGTSARMIAEKTGMHYSSMYRYFPNKIALFDVVVGEFYRKFKSGFSKFMDITDDHSLAENRISNLGQILFTAIKDDRKKFVILLRRSKGTKYAVVFDELAAMLKVHIVQEIQSGIDDNYVVEVIARNFFKGISDIAERCQDMEILQNSVSSFVRYHLSGMESFNKQNE